MRAMINGISMNYEVYGQGEPVLFIHGFPLSGQMWNETVASLKGDYRLIVPDLRGHGGSTATAEATMGDYADDLAALLEHLKEARPVVVVGLSMGGYVALEFYRRQSRRVRAMVLVDTRAEADAPEAAKGRREMADKVLREGSRVAADAMIGKLFAPEAAAEMRSRWQTIMAATPPRGVAAALLGMAGRVDSLSTLSSMNVPTLVVVGEKDVITPPDGARRMHETVQGSRLEIIPGAGHMAPVEKPVLFNAILKKFLDEVAKR